VRTTLENGIPMQKNAAIVSVATRFTLAMNDIRDGIFAWPIWSTLAWQDIRQRYRRSVLGPLWITLTMVVTIAGMGPLYAALFRVDAREFIPYLALGIISWGLISMLILEGCATFSGADTLIRSVRLPLTMHAFRMISRNVIIFLHNCMAYIPFMIYLGIQPTWTWLMIIPGLIIVILAAVPVAIIFGLFCARFRDMQPIIGSVVQLAFFLTPIFWKPEALGNRVAFAKYNPLYMLVDLLRGPILGYVPGINVYIGVGVIALSLYAVAIPMFVRYRSRVAFWV
jgi:lipopolysaccharide transport system permease protein